MCVCVGGGVDVCVCLWVGVCVKGKSKTGFCPGRGEGGREGGREGEQRL